MQIGVFFGSFDPPHLGHLCSAQQLVKSGGCDQIWLMPCFAHVWQKKLVSSKHRLAMLKFLADKKIKISDLEIKAKRALYTIETLAILKKKYPQHRFSLVIGEKSLKELVKWKDHQKLKRDYPLLVAPEIPGVSSSIIRERLKKVFRLLI